MVSVEKCGRLFIFIFVTRCACLFSTPDKKMTFLDDVCQPPYLSGAEFPRRIEFQLKCHYVLALTSPMSIEAKVIRIQRGRRRLKHKSERMQWRTVVAGHPCITRYSLTHQLSAVMPAVLRHSVLAFYCFGIRDGQNKCCINYLRDSISYVSKTWPLCQSKFRFMSKTFHELYFSERHN